MILGCPPYSGAGDGPPDAVVDYTMNVAVQKRTGLGYQILQRDPAPELLIGSPALSLMALKALRTKHRYSIATLSLDATDVDVRAFNIGDPKLRRQIGKTLNLFLESAYYGIPRCARLHPLVATHTHRDRLEVNILMPRATWSGKAGIASHNPHPPLPFIQEFWHHFLDTANASFGWADPMEPERRHLTKLPDRLTKTRREIERQGQPFQKTLPEQVATLVEELWKQGNIPVRNDLIMLMAPGLDARNVRVLHACEKWS